MTLWNELRARRSGICSGNYKTMKRKVLVILSNRLDRYQKVRYVEIECDNDGNIENEKALKTEPHKAIYDEVWENDDGKTTVSSCSRFKRRYRHALEKPKATA